MPKEKLKDDLELEADDGTIIKMGELRQFIKGEKLSPSDLFNKYDLLEDPMMKEAIEEGVEFELEFRDREAEEELNEEMRKEIDEEENYGLYLPGQMPSSEPQQKKKPDKEQRPPESDEGDLLPPSDDDDKSSEGGAGDQENEGPLLPG